MILDLEKSRLIFFYNYNQRTSWRETPKEFATLWVNVSGLDFITDGIS